jgi:Flp pilus assembly protein TadD
LGYALYLKGDLKAAETALRQATRENANNERAINNLAMVVGQQGRSQEAYALFRSIVDEAEANSNLAYVMSRAGKTDQAAKRYSVALTIDEDLEKAQVALLQLAEKQQIAQRLENLRDSQNEVRTAEVPSEVPVTRSEPKVRPVSSTSDDTWYEQESSEFELPALIDRIE